MDVFVENIEPVQERVLAHQGSLFWLCGPMRADQPQGVSNRVGMKRRFSKMQHIRMPQASLDKHIECLASGGRGGVLGCRRRAGVAWLQ